MAANPRQMPMSDGAFVWLGTLKFGNGAAGSVTITNNDVDGFVIIDAVVWVPVK